MTDAPEPGSAIRSIRIPKPLRKRLKDFADANQMSMSEVVREAMEAYTEGKVPLEDRMRTTERITVWAPPEKYAKFRAKVRENKTTVTNALESALEGIL